MASGISAFQNPFRPGAGHPPPYLAGRESEKSEFARLLEQDTILENLILTGLRGIGKTVLLDALRPTAISEGWFWIGGQFSESASYTEERVAVRVLTDLSVLTSQIALPETLRRSTGRDHSALTYEVLEQTWKNTPGLPVDKLKAVLTSAWTVVSQAPGTRGLIFAYDEVQTLNEDPERGQYPTALLLDTFQSLQRQGLPLMLVFAGLPNLLRKLVDSRTYAERMFRVCFVDRLSAEESEEAIRKPIADAACPLQLSDDSVKEIVKRSGGYPYFLQFICKEVYDTAIQQVGAGETPFVPVPEIERKLDSDFFAGRWARCSDRQRDLLGLIARLESPDTEFAVKDVEVLSRTHLDKPFSGSHIVQMLAALERKGLIFKDRRACYAFAVPLFGQFIRRELASSTA